MKVICVGVDPAGLYLAALLKRMDRRIDVEIVDTGMPATSNMPPLVMRHPLKPDWAFADPDFDRALRASSRQARGVRLRRPDADFTTDRQNFGFIAAAQLREILKDWLRKLGCRFASGAIPDAARLEKADVVLVADGVRSPLRTTQGGAFGARLRAVNNLHILFDTDLVSDRFEYWFHRTPHGIFHASLMPCGEASVLLVETTQSALDGSGLANMDLPESAQYCGGIFARELEGRELKPRRVRWQNFVEVRNARWAVGNMMLVGAAAYNSHHSIGLDARTSLADVEAFAGSFRKSRSIPAAMMAYEIERRANGAESLQRASRASIDWFENMHRYYDMPPQQFAFSCLTRSMRVTHEHLKSWAPDLVDEVDALTAGATRGRNGAPPPPMFTPYRLGELALPNRVVMSPMCMYSADDGIVNDFHMVHYGSRAIGGAGLIIAEMTDVTPEGRISLGCAGMYKPEHAAAWKRVVDFVHKNSGTKIGVQLAHAGRKGSISTSWEGHAQLPPDKAWATLAASAIPFDAGRAAPKAMDRNDMDVVRDAFVNAAHMSREAGFDMIELHFAHGYLLSSFISPLSNKRADEYGGGLENRMRYPLEIMRAVRDAWPKERPITVRISAYDFLDDGTSVDDSFVLSRRLRDAGADMITVSTGAVTADRRPMIGRLYQTTFSDQIRNETKIPTMAVGGIASFADANTIIAAGRADLCAMARGYMFDPYFPRHAAHRQGYGDMRWPNQYRGADALTMRDF